MILEAEDEKVKDFKLDSGDIFLLDMCGLTIYAWVGKGASKKENKMLLKLSEDYLKSVGKPKAVICTVFEDNEHATFWQDFKQ